MAAVGQTRSTIVTPHHEVPESHRTEAAPALFSPLVPSIGFLLLGGMAWLYASGSSLYGRILTYWMSIPWRYPFIDLAAIPAWVKCWHQGFDVYTTASWAACDVGPIIYSPLWLRFTFLPTDKTWTNWLGLSELALFLLSLGLLPQPRRRFDRTLVVLGTFSSLPVYAMERGNIDLIMFMLCVIAVFCLAGSLVVRIMGYGCMLVAGLLKFYPLVLFILLLRERLVVCIALGLAVVAIVSGFAFVFLDELLRIGPMPGGTPFYGMLGARNMPQGFGTVLQAFLQAIGMQGPWIENLPHNRVVATIVIVALLPTALFLALHLTRRSDIRMALGELPARDHRFLLIGAVLVAACFFAGQNTSYRGVLLLLVLPAVLSLTHTPAGPGARRIFALTAAAVLCSLWQIFIRHAAADLFGGAANPVAGSLAMYTVWTAQELIWWWLAAVLLAIVIRFCLDSSSWQELSLILTRADPGRGQARST